MAGQMGNATATILNLEVLEIIADDNAVVVSGAVPGPDGALLAFIMRLVRASART